MKIGIYLDKIDFSVPSHQRLHTAVLEGLVRQNTGRHEFIVLTWSAVEGHGKNSPLRFVTLREDKVMPQKWASLKRKAFSPFIRPLRFLGLWNDALATMVAGWHHTRPAYFDQLKELEIDALWFITGIELPTPLPTVRTVLDINHRIHPEYWEPGYLNAMESFWRNITKAAFVITGTNEGKRQIASLYNVYEPRIRVIPYPTPLLPDPEKLPPPKLDFEGPYLLYPARFWRLKNHVVAVEAVKVLREKWNIEMRVVFTGKDGKDSEIEGNNLQYVLAYAEKLGVRDLIKPVGEVSIEELTALYKHALALAYVSATGPDNLPPLEAMSVGCPAIVADVPGAREQYGDAALFYPPQDEHALATYVKFLLENPAARQDLIAKGTVRARKWTVDDYAKEVISLFDEFALIARAWGSSSKVHL